MKCEKCKKEILSKKDIAVIFVGSGGSLVIPFYRIYHKKCLDEITSRRAIFRFALSTLANPNALIYHKIINYLGIFTDGVGGIIIVVLVIKQLDVVGIPLLIGALLFFGGILFILIRNLIQINKIEKLPK